MSDTRNHTTRDQLAEVLYSVLVDHHVWIGDDGQPLDYSPEREARLGDLIHDLADALLASDAIAAVRAAAVAETTAAIEALLRQVEDDARENQHLARLSTREVRAALSGGRTALDTAKAAAWDEALEAVANERGSFGMQTRNPYRDAAGADQ